MAKKNSAAITVGRSRSMKGRPAPAARQIKKAAPTAPFDTSDHTLAALLDRLKTAADPGEIRRLTDQIERVVFHKQFTNA
jgi:hypothetical protein